MNGGMMLTDSTRFALLEGYRQPQTPEENFWLVYMGGARGPKENWPAKWCVCDTCRAEWKARAFFPSPTGHWVYPYRCPDCWAKSKDQHKRPVGKQKEQRPAELKLD